MGVCFQRTLSFFFSLKLLKSINTPTESFNKSNHPCDLSEAKIKLRQKIGQFKAILAIPTNGMRTPQSYLKVSILEVPGLSRS